MTEAVNIFWLNKNWYTQKSSRN